MNTTDTALRPAPRADIQGLRAVAVVAVILNHVIGWPSGGFVGVDVFFVISGFLITGLLLRDGSRDGRPSMRAFYGRRIRRIAPASITVLIAVGVAGWFVFNQPRFWSTLQDAIASFLLVSNWRFAAEGTDYFHAGDAVSPLQHFWSLSVEEQFYLVWPALIVIVLLAVGGLKASEKRRRTAIAIVMGVIVVASFGFAMWQSQTSPTVAYFSTLTRAWELGLGALLATAVPLLARIPFGLRVVLGWVGLAGIIGSFFLIDDTMSFPGPWAALPVIATAFVVAAGVGGPQRYLLPIANPVTSFVGDISYSLYLWHFPVLVFLAVLLPDQGLQSILIVLGLTLALSLVSYFLIEQPLHRTPHVVKTGDQEADRTARQEAWQGWRDRFGAQFMLSGLGLVVIVVVSVVTVQISLRGDGPLALQVPGDSAAVAAGNGPGSGGAPDGSGGSSGTDGSGGDGSGGAPVNPEDQMQADLWAAASATAWPGNLSPSMDSAISDTSSHNPAKDCFEVGSTPDFGRCTWGSGDAPNHMYLVGDSTAMAYAPAFKELAESSGGQWKVTTIGLYGCRFTDTLIQNDGDGVMDACPQRKADIAARIASDSPQLVVVSNAFALGNAVDRRPLSASSIVASTFAETAKYNAGGRIVYLAPPPLGANLGACYSPVTSPQNCNAAVDGAWNDFAGATQLGIQNTGSGDHFVSSLGFSCAGGYCPAFAGTLPVKYDQVHMTPEYSKHIAPALRWELAAQGLM
ncbi:acyltransferase family protein [Herbiconiux solani]|uniref:acyltransferase family protein n=1 Tax=Herbiconiux solani TaxID=661329 RepID=UPI000825FBEF|nr:acyltransferase family protein [Herbiconiux solani]